MYPITNNTATMPRQRSGWFKPYRLTRRNIESVVAENTPGVYVLGDLGADHKLRARKIASGTDVKSELEKFIGQFQAFTFKPFKHQLGIFQNTQPTLW